MKKERAKCVICEKEMTANNSYIGSHTKRTHGIKIIDYVKAYYKCESPEFKYEKCGFCENDAEPFYKINHQNHSYTLDYKGKYFCDTQECKNNISLLIFGKKYDKKKFEYIGSNSKYLSLLHKTDIKEVNYKKSKGLRELEFSTNLENFIKKYGEEEGTRRYKERNYKIGKSNTKQWYIDKFGNIEGLKKWEKYRKKMHKGFGPVKSKTSRIIDEFLKKFNISYIEEYKYENKEKKNGAIDFYLPDYNIVIEFYGDYWHCNPNIYEKTYYHAILKRFAYEIWEKDKNRITHIFESEFKKKITILIIWESTKFSDEYLLNLLNEIKGKNIILEI